MKIYRSDDFNTSDESIWKSRVLKLGEGPIFTAKTVITGVEFEAKKIVFGPITIRKYKSPEDVLWSGRGCTVELIFQDKSTNPPQDTPMSMYVQPFWLMHSIFIAMQLYANSWVGYTRINYLDKHKKYAGTFGGQNVADTRSIAEQPIITRLNRKRLLQLLDCQFGTLELAIDRYSKACTEIVDESIIDFVIVLENLLGIGLNGEISHRVSSRGAMILAPNKEDRENYYITLKYLYDLRSQMVHGKIDEIKSPAQNSKKGVALKAVGTKLTGTWWEDRYNISNTARVLTRAILLYFINNTDKWNEDFLFHLDLGIKS
ncbi:hypothetical protein H6802_00435 [Candidatus Nomurabacteria bacterium]|uniref:Apea-like HEPN domain-containing protein n=1 Tax=candidate division WWE3 bacterium TaxID=2053526 RepID=A0A955E089_UNCKA|nr:hypothetical protein [candidate division WWE3 bacterium]MCB9823416.1 hypothetical protein [Candidatus Nomurabacteria bacterium]MCB9827698.1 hypothetical protein [Candidatus Nomurabacteria bacterium]